MKKTVLLAALLAVCTTLVAQNEKQTFSRKVLLEQFTTAQCGWCPSGTERIEQAISGSTNVIWIKYHAGFGTDALTNSLAEEMTRFYGGSTFAPALMIDRTRWIGTDAGPVMSVGQASDIRSYIAAAREVATACKVYTPEVSFDATSRQLRCTTSGRFGESGAWNNDTRLVLYLIEDSLFMRQKDYNNGSASNQYLIDFWHFGTVRDALTDQWGDPLTVDEADNMSFNHSVTYTLPNEYDFHNCRVVAVVYQYDSENINNCPVLNAAQSDYLDQHLGIAEATGGRVRLFPNPAEQRVVVECESPMRHIEVLDALGRSVLTVDPAGRQQVAVEVADLSAGLYIVRALTAQGTVSRQLVVK